MIGKQQQKILAFPYTKYIALICDGAVRSGKTSIMTVAYVDWAMREFNNTSFAICGKTVGSAIKNIVTPYMSMSYAKKRYGMKFTRSDNKIIITKGNITNTFYIFGGKDESSQDLIQGITLGGVFLDEVALMPRSFVEQALARCSVTGARFFFNCNPESPVHWFYKEWILKSKERNALHLHFTMEDNPGLTEETIFRYKTMYSGVFYQRFVLGEWVRAEGLVYQNFDEKRHVTELTDLTGTYYISCDYGIVNPFSAHLWCVSGAKAYCIDEYYYNGREKGQQLTDEEHYAAVDALAGNRQIAEIIIDPSATSFKETIRRHDKYNVRGANNEVITGIANCMMLLDAGAITFSPKVKNMFAEFKTYSWDTDSPIDRPIKECDHAMDDFRYFVNTVLKREWRHLDWQKES